MGKVKTAAAGRRHRLRDAPLRVSFVLYMVVTAVAATVVCAVIFYRRKLKRPIELLDAASQKIAENDLDFTVETPCGNELGRLCASFEKMRAALLMLNREHWAQMEERRRLNAAFAHDLRTPLTVLRGRACLLGAGLPPDSEAAAEGLSVSVTDDGGGFTKEGLEKAPAPFYKGEGSGSGHLGLGLNICDILCRRHNGRLCIENVPNGARVTAVFGRRQSK